MSVLKKNKNLPIIILLIVLLIVAVILGNSGGRSRTNTRKHVSMIVYGDDAERWENMREGAALVCEEKDADLSLINMMTENDTAEQKEIIDREIEDGADALVIAACNSNEIREYIQSKNIRIPVIFLETMDASEQETKYISADDYDMGYGLGEELLKSESEIVTVAVVSENTGRDSVAFREKGFMDAIEGKVGKIIEWKRNTYEAKANTRMFLQRAIVSEATDVIVTFDNSTTDALLDALENLNKSSKIYAVSTSNKAVYNLYNKEIKALEYPDEFSMGYLAALNALDRNEANRKYAKKRIDHRIVRKENMYDENNQKLLFPFVY